MKLGEKDIKLILNEYDLGVLKDFEKIEKGFMNSKYIVSTTKGKYTLRIGNGTKEEKDLQFEIDLLNHLSNELNPIYIKNKKKKYVSKIGKLPLTVYKYIEGETPKIVNESLLKSLARYAANLHNKSSSFKSEIDRFSWYTFDLEKIHEFEDFISMELSNQSKNIEYMKKEMIKLVLPDTLPSGPIHCDIKRENVLTKNGKLNGVLDFDNCQIGPYLLDLAICIMWFCTSKSKLNYKRAITFIREYNKVRKLNSDERKYLYQAIKYAYISHMYVDFYVYAKNIISKDYFDFGIREFLGASKNMNYLKYRIYEKIYL